MKEINVLFVDDEESILRSIKGLFINDSFSIETTSNLDKAIDIIENENIKVIFVDYRMPKITGVEFLKKIKKEYPDIIRILFTGYADIQAIEEAINEVQVYHFVSKPWDITDLKVTVSNAIAYYDLTKDNKMLVEDLKEKNCHLNVLLESQKEFTSTVSHELRTPLASMKTSMDIILSGTPGELTEDQRDIIGMAKESTDRLKRLVDDILDYTKMESGKVKLQLEKVNVNQVITNLLKVYKKLAEDQGTELECELGDEIPTVVCDKDRLNQVLINLIDNAIKFTEGGRVTVFCTHSIEDDGIKVCVKDTGVGICEEDMPKLFNEFQQLGHSSERKQGGTGLGLVICKRIVEHHGGKIWVKSDPGKGSSFCFVLPIIKEKEDIQ